MARPNKKTSNHKSLGDNQYSNKFNENVTTLTTKFAEQVEFNVGDIALYVGGMYAKNTQIKITNIFNQKSKVHYSGIFLDTNQEVSYIKSTVLKKIEQENNENTNIESEEINNENN